MADTGTPTRRNGHSAPAEEIGAVGAPIYGGRVFDEYLPELQGDKALYVYREMGNDPVISSAMYGIDKNARQTQMTVSSADGDNSQQTADFVQSCFDDLNISWGDTLSAILTMAPFGWSFFEHPFKQRTGLDTEDGAKRSRFDDGMWGWRKFAFRRQITRLRWLIAQDGGVDGMIQLPPPTFDERRIPIDQALLFRTTAATGSPEGTSLIRGCYEAWFYKKHISRYEAIGLERDIAGMPYANVRAKWLSTQANDAEQTAVNGIDNALKAIRQGEASRLIMPQDYDSEGNPLVEWGLLRAAGEKQFDTDKIIARYDQRIAMPLLADFILLGHEQVGSYNLGSSKIDLFAAAIDVLLSQVADVLNSHAIPRLLAVNGIQRRLSPVVSFSSVARPDLTAMGTFIQSLAKAGGDLFPNPELLSWFLRSAGVPTKIAEAHVQEMVQTPPVAALEKAFAAAGLPAAVALQAAALFGMGDSGLAA